MVCPWWTTTKGEIFSDAKNRSEVAHKITLLTLNKDYIEWFQFTRKVETVTPSMRKEKNGGKIGWN
ncbi:hypothetical protein K3495_g10683 [Podosphaera aphanis]|nr:hypothetical protein K3495_g10683 [Podosphaera aphanis]